MLEAQRKLGCGLTCYTLDAALPPCLPVHCAEYFFKNIVYMPHAHPVAHVSEASPPVLPSALTALTPEDYLKKILNARVYDVAIESALEPAKILSQHLGNTVLFKREDQQPIFSFKLRGAYNKMAHLSAQQLQQGVICASAGNHAQGVALSARKLQTRAVVVMPLTTPQLKVDAVRALGAQIVLHGQSYTEAHAHALHLQEQQNLTFVHPFDDPDVIAGQGTVAMEILRQIQSINAGRLDAIFVAVGGGGLISGVANYIKALRPDIKIIGVQTTDSDAMLQSVTAKQRVTLAEVGLFADGSAVKLVGEETLRIASNLVDGYEVVNTDALCAAIKDIFIDTRSIVEPSGALAVAAIKQYVARHQTQGQTYAAILCGANINFDQLRFVAERAEAGQEREALFAVTIAERPGTFLRLCELINTLPDAPHHVTQFNYRMHHSHRAHVFMGLSTQGPGQSQRIAHALSAAGFTTLDLTHDDLAQEHIRHMVGGHLPPAQHERLLRLTFPERSGALLKFLRLLQPHWSISLFHYRNQGADYGHVLVGLQLPPQDHPALNACLDALGYPYVEETQNPIYQLFLTTHASN